MQTNKIVFLSVLLPCLILGFFVIPFKYYLFILLQAVPLFGALYVTLPKQKNA